MLLQGCVIHVFVRLHNDEIPNTNFCIRVYKVVGVLIDICIEKINCLS